MLENVGGELGGTARLRDSGQSAPCPYKDAAEDLRARRRPRNLVDLGLGVDGEQPDAELMGARDVTLLLDGVAVGNAVRLAPACSTSSTSPMEATSSRSRARSEGSAPRAPDWP